MSRTLCAFDDFPPELREMAKLEAERIWQLAYSMQGDKAFENPKRAAALHEAGHAVAFQCVADGRFCPPTEVKIFRAEENRAHWVGSTLDKTPRMGLTTPAEMWKSAVRTLSGVVAEALFAKEDYRYGSSVDEVVRGQLAAVQLARMVYAPAEEISLRLNEDTRTILERNANIVEMLAARIERTHKAKGPELRRLLDKAKAPKDVGAWVPLGK